MSERVWCMYPWVLLHWICLCFSVSLMLLLLRSVLVAENWRIGVENRQCLRGILLNNMKKEHGGMRFRRPSVALAFRSLFLLFLLSIWWTMYDCYSLTIGHHRFISGPRRCVFPYSSVKLTSSGVLCLSLCVSGQHRSPRTPQVCFVLDSNVKPISSGVLCDSHSICCPKHAIQKASSLNAGALSLWHSQPQWVYGMVRVPRNLDCTLRP